MKREGQEQTFEGKKIKDDGVLHIKKEYLLPDTVQVEVPIEAKKGGQNKKKDRRNNAKREVKLCFRIAAGEECFGCEFSHDLEAFLAIKGPDLGCECPLFDQYGRCKYGLKCRFAAVHTSADQKQLSKDIVHEESEFVLNALSPDTQKKIRAKEVSLMKSKLFENAYLAGKNSKSEEDVSNEEVDLGLADYKASNPEVKPISFKNKTYLAPLTTVGNMPFRRICKGFGVDITCAEMTIANNLLQGNRHEWALMKRHVSEDVYGVQVTGNHPVLFTEACEVIQQTLTVDFIDLNLGCPVEGVTSKGHGSALMDKRGRLKSMIQGAISVIEVPLTVKLRTGIRDGRLFADKLIPLFQNWGVSAVTLHGRTKEQRYTKLADWSYIEKCSSLVDRSEHTKEMAFIGNGDIFNPQDYLEHLNNTKTIDGLMIGRGALIKPWIFKEIKEQKLWDITSTERLDILKDFARYGIENWGSDTMGINQTRKYLCEWQSFLHRYVPVGLLEVLPQTMNKRPDKYFGRNELETLMASEKASDWIKITELILGKADPSFSFIPKHKSNSYEDIQG